MQLSNTESNEKMAYTKSPEEDDLLPRCPREKARENRRKERKTRTQKITCKEKEKRVSIKVLSIFLKLQLTQRE